MEYRNFKLVYRRYASLYFIVGIDATENELSILEFIHMIVETYDNYFDGVCELDVRNYFFLFSLAMARPPHFFRVIFMKKKEMFFLRGNSLKFIE